MGIWFNLSPIPADSFHRLRVVPLPRGGRSGRFAGQGLRPCRRLDIGALRSPLSPFARPLNDTCPFPRPLPKDLPLRGRGTAAAVEEGRYGRERCVFISRSRSERPSSVSLTRASTTFYGIAATGSYFRFNSLRDAPPLRRSPFPGGEGWEISTVFTAGFQPN